MQRAGIVDDFETAVRPQPDSGLMDALTAFDYGGVEALRAWVDAVPETDTREFTRATLTDVVDRAQGDVDVVRRELRAVLPPAPLPFTQLRTTYTPTDWLIDDWAVRGDSGVFFANGDMGKSWIAQMLVSALATGKDWCGLLSDDSGLLRAPMPVVYAGYEDGVAKFSNRQIAISTATGVEETPPANLHFIEMRPYGAIWGIDTNKQDAATWTETGYALRAACELVMPALLVIDPVIEAYNDSENDANAVRSFQAALSAWAGPLGITTLLIAHTPKEGQSPRGSGDWRNAARFVWGLENANCGTVFCPNCKGWKMLMRDKCNDAVRDTDRVYVKQMRGPRFDEGGGAFLSDDPPFCLVGESSALVNSAKENNRDDFDATRYI